MSRRSEETNLRLLQSSFAAPENGHLNDSHIVYTAGPSEHTNSLAMIQSVHGRKGPRCIEPELVKTKVEEYCKIMVAETALGNELCFKQVRDYIQAGSAQDKESEFYKRKMADGKQNGIESANAFERAGEAKMMIKLLAAALENNGHCTIGGENVPQIGTPLTGLPRQAQSSARNETLGHQPTVPVQTTAPVQPTTPVQPTAPVQPSAPVFNHNELQTQAEPSGYQNGMEAEGTANLNTDQGRSLTRRQRRRHKQRKHRRGATQSDANLEGEQNEENAEGVQNPNELNPETDLLLSYD